LQKTYFSVRENAAGIPGTTANLKAGQRLKIIDLIHALMLPSGNDAAVTLAENFGELIIKTRGLKTIANRAKLSTPNPEKLREGRPDPQLVSRLNNPVSIFVKEMNRTAISSFHLKCTSFTNPHGLADKGNHSTAFDIAMLAFNALKDQNFREIVNKQKHECITYVKRR
jgi:serine-type D-Ala-D-Ala carboxypeptidase (penicillin-binding protein 5/6)